MKEPFPPRSAAVICRVGLVGIGIAMPLALLLAIEFVRTPALLADEPSASAGVAAAPLPAGSLPAGSLPAGSLPAGSLPAGSLPAGSLPADSRQAADEPDSVVQVANLVYAGTKSSQCFADHFLIQAEKDSAISTSRRFHAVKLGSDELYNFPLVIMTGEGAFALTDRERENLTKYVQHGGFLLASAGCSSGEWDRSFRKEMGQLFPKSPLQALAMDHPVFHTVYDIRGLETTHGGEPHPLEGISIGGRLGVLYSPDGLNDTAHSHGCCCCGGNELGNCVQINVNILAYALTH